MVEDEANAGTNPGIALYKDAYDKVSGMVTNFKDKLIADQIYGNALSLKALCELNLSKLDAAKITATEANTYIDRSAHPDKQRDKALMAGMPGLIKANQLVSMLKGVTGKLSQNKYSDLAALAGGALTDIGIGRNAVSKTHPANSYLIQSQLVVAKSWIDGINKTLDNATEEEVQLAESREKGVREKAVGFINDLTKVQGADSKMIDQWKAIIGIAK